ncbi:4-phosphoerythronate dehydrogenase [Alkalimonas collagenimarina]|uniref:Erythronate-4-phosphate dehydrogenase n=1 Tax=Alkalimonas collagenimarina TaxID=400390 RepID=A0ABT9GV93_9GAMM|nr:4-phosphoerythronate dehydrogenase [Alkalimonas collagenimarina]MDP4534975.1 4-phosphoerythronate dehydrogenase [Alkalimonas collagenimarina]
MKIYADENMPYAQQFFADFGEVRLFAGRELTAEQLSDADVLLVRSITQVSAALLTQAKQLRFVGTATIGTDHIDQAYLAEHSVAFSSAPGCNARAVVEYIVSALFTLAERYQWQLRDKVIGIVGVGNIGRRLVDVFSALGCQLLLCDPLRAETEPDFPHCPFEQLVQQADVLSFHVPQCQQGPYATRHLINQQTLVQLKPDCALLNACRGNVFDNQALLNEAQAGRLRPLVLDVWEQEPDILLPLLPYVDIATAHIAGHSVEGKARGTEMLYQQLCQLLGEPVVHSIDAFCPPAAVSAIEIHRDFGLPDVQNLFKLVYDVRRDDALLRHYIETQGFDWLRKHYPPRRECSTVRVLGDQLPDWLYDLGFSRP